MARGQFSMRVTGLDATISKLTKRFGRAKVKKALTSALLLEAHELIREAKKETPVDEGILRGSGEVDKPKSNGDVVCGFGGAAIDYALIQHETKSFKHPGGGKWKYLEDPFDRRFKGVPGRTARRLKRFLKI